jgi:hypothetical protein
MSSYKLCNPVIGGDLKTSFKGKSALDAANKTWSSISKYISNNVPQFAFTLEKSDGSLHHFTVSEKKNGKEATFKINKLSLDLDRKQERDFKKRLAQGKKQAGGKKHKKRDDDDDDSSSSSELEGIISPWTPYHTGILPITYWWYDPYVYSLDSLYIPTFVYPLVPYIEVSTISYYPY